MNDRPEQIAVDSWGQWWINLDGDPDFDPDLIKGREEQFWTYNGNVNPAIVGPYLTRFAAERELSVIRQRANGAEPGGPDNSASETLRVRLHHDKRGYAVHVQHTDDVWRPATAVNPGPYLRLKEAEDALSDWIGRNPSLERFNDYVA